MGEHPGQLSAHPKGGRVKSGGIGGALVLRLTEMVATGRGTSAPCPARGRIVL